MTKVSENTVAKAAEAKTKGTSGQKTTVHEQQQRGTVVFPLQYNLCNTVNKNYDLWLHWHNEFELIHVISGTYNLFINNRDIALEKDDLCFIPGKTVHGDSQNKGQALYESMVFDIDMLRPHSYTPDIFINDIITNTITPVNHISAKDYPEICETALKCFETVKLHRDGYELITSGYLLIFLGQMQHAHLFSEKKMLPAHKKARTEQLEQVLTLIRKNYDQDLTLQQMADMAGLSSKYFCRIFREMTDRSPIEYLNWFRINRACNLLRETDDKLPDIAYNCGFNDFSYFIKTFRRYKGMTPLKYRNFDPLKNGSVNSIGAEVSEGYQVANSMDKED